MKVDFGKLIKSFKWAFHGLKLSIAEEQNIRIEISLFVIGAILGIVYRIDWIEWLFLINAGIMVLIAELLNTSLEKITDQESSKRKMSFAKQAKDLAAGAVLLSVFYGLIVGLILFGHRLLSLLNVQIN